MAANNYPQGDPRNEILRRFLDGDIDHEQAEAEAQEAGFESMVFRPDSGKLDPMAKPFWTLPMALAWVIYRTPDTLLNLNGSPPFDVIAEAVSSTNDDRDMASRYLAIRDEFFDHLKRGTFVAYGIPRGECKHYEIPRIEWPTIDTLFEYDPVIGPNDVGNNSDKVGKSGKRTARYLDVFVSREAVTSIWAAGPKPGIAELSDDDAKAVLLAEIKQIGGFIGQEKGSRILRDIYPGFNKKRAMRLVKELTGNTKPGPRGPRKKCAPNCA